MPQMNSTVQTTQSLPFQLIGALSAECHFQYRSRSDRLQYTSRSYWRKALLPLP